MQNRVIVVPNVVLSYKIGASFINHHMEVHCAKMHTANADYALQSTMLLGRRARAEKPFFTASRLEMSDGRGSDLCGRGTTDRDRRPTDRPRKSSA